MNKNITDIRCVNYDCLLCKNSKGNYCITDFDYNDLFDSNVSVLNDDICSVSKGGNYFAVARNKKTTADYIAALEMVGLETLKDKLDYKIGKYGENSTDLSDGQWQKIALARVLLSDAKMFLLDEPTASMDPIGESKL